MTSTRRTNSGASVRKELARQQPPIRQIQQRRTSFSSLVRSRSNGSNVQLRRRLWRSHAFVRGLELNRRLKGHTGCVNTIAWNARGTLLVSGSDDTTVKVWPFNRNHDDDEPGRTSGSAVQTYESGHVRNVFSAEFVPTSNDTAIVTTALDGMIRLLELDDAGGCTSRLLGRCSEMVLGVAFPSVIPCAVFTAQQDGLCRSYDMRASNANPSATVVDLKLQRGLTSIDFHPELPYEFALAGEDSIIRQYDVRAATRGPIMCYRQTCESGQTYTRRHQGGVSSIRFSRRATGTCLLANYRNAPMALFDASVGSKKRAPVLFFESRDNSASSAKRIGAQHADDGVTSPMMTLMEGPVASEVVNYSGRRNVDTFAKTAAFWGNDDAFVVSGSDSGNVFFWDTTTGERVNKMRADSCIVNCVAPHPYLPELAVSGIDSDIKYFAMRRSTPHWTTQAERGDERSSSSSSDDSDEDTDDSSGSEESSFESDDSIDLRQRRMHAPLSVMTVLEMQEAIELSNEHRARGIAHYRLNENDAALSAFTAAAEQIEDSSASSFAQEATRVEALTKCQLNMAAVMIRQKEWASAAYFSTEVIQRDPFRVKALFRRARARVEMGELDGAVEDLQRALEEEPSNAAVARLLRVAKVRRKAKRKAQAARLRKGFSLEEK